MKNADIGQGAEYRKKFQVARPCSRLLVEGHSWARVHFQGMVVAVVCMDCGRYPLEIMSMWESVAKWKTEGIG